MGGLCDKYCITKFSGEPVDPNAQYFVLRLDTDKHACTALRESYIPGIRCDNPELADVLARWLVEIGTELPELKAGDAVGIIAGECAGFNALVCGPIKGTMYYDVTLIDRGCVINRNIPRRDLYRYNWPGAHE